MGRLPPRHPCHFEVKRGGSTLSRLGAASAHPQGLALIESRLRATGSSVLSWFFKQSKMYGRAIPVSPLEEWENNRLLSACYRSTSYSLTHKFCGGAEVPLGLALNAISAIETCEESTAG